MKKLDQVRLDAIVDSHRRKLVTGAMIIMIMSCIVLVMCLIGMFKDPAHSLGYNIVFALFSVIAFFGIVQYDKHKRDFK